jgi:hypothetical protein
VAVAGVLVLSDAEDKSHYKPADVRHYLAEIGVPPFVWSLKGPRPELADSWGHSTTSRRSRTSASPSTSCARRSMSNGSCGFLPIRSARFGSAAHFELLTDLDAGDFRVLVDGKQAKIESVTWVDDASEEVATRSATPKSRRRVGSSSSSCRPILSETQSVSSARWA